MKKFLVMAICLLAALSLAGAAYAAMAAGSGIKGTFHDLSSTGASGALYGDTDHLDRVCIYCHAPHRTLKPADALAETNPVGYVPLWNHAITTTASWTTYDNGADDPADPAHFADSTLLSGTPGSVSLLCLSCHDGSVAANQYGSWQVSADEKLVGAAKSIGAANRASIGFGGDLSNHHPIGFDYASVAQADGGSDDEIAGTATIMVGTTTIGDLLWNGKMECGTCHDVHNTKNTGEKFTWVQDTNSNFCLVCHLKNQ